MGVTLDQVNQGLLDVSKIISDGMRAWDNVTGKSTPKAAQTTTSQAQPAAPAAATQQTLNQSPAGGAFFSSLPPWAWVAIAIVGYAIAKGRI